MTKRIFRSILLVSIASCFVGLAFVIGILYQYFDNQLMRELENSAYYLSIAVEHEGISALDDLPEGKERITIIGTDGTVLYDTSSNPATMENHNTREEVQEARENGSGKAVRQSNTLGHKNIYYALKLSNGQILRVSSTQYNVATLLLNLIQPILWIFALIVLLATIFSFRASKKIVEPLNKLDLNNPDINEPYEEIAPLLTKISRQKRTIRSQLSKAKRQQEEFSLITNHMEEGLLVIDKQTELLSYNNSALQLLGAKETKPQGSIFILNRSEPFRQVVNKALSGERTEAVLQINDLFYRLTGNPVFHHDEIEGAVLLLIDITEKMQREQLRNEFTANISHELKTPLTSISGFAEIIQNGLVLPEDIPKFAERIFTESQRLITLVSDIIKISQLDESVLPYEKETVDLYKTAKEILDRLTPAAEKMDVRLCIEQSSATLEIVKPIFEEVIYNLCDNAIKYNNRGGSVQVIIQQTDEITSIAVKDTGIGIPVSDQQRIFERFYRVDKSHSKEIGGTGLGLSIVKHGASYLGADVKVTSTMGKGTTFTLIWTHI
ncbi:sensor histidine kinase [Clostridium facile]|uniref:histidine kinase n=1 Tax=Clostridium facile TaxID=2763035 RepID=A0ABR7ISM5_9CLOT|nr:ATP-binding protein [Clostridium facile]MBC5788156.1 ATP-binding protein [Clostridium facile]